MKLRDFNARPIPRKKTPTVFHLSNEAQEKKAEVQIKSLEGRVKKLTGELNSLLPLPERLRELQHALQIKEQQIQKLTRNIERDKLLLDRAEEQALQIPKYEEEIKTLKHKEQSQGNRNIRT